jgi:hypothetical protein
MKTTLLRVSVSRIFALSLSLGLGSSACESEQGDSANKSVGSDDAGAGGGEQAWCEVKALLDKKCVECHDGEGSAGTPMGLSSYDDLQAAAVVSTGKKVFEAVSARIHDAKRPMPAQGPLEADQLALIDGWIAAGAPAGDDPTCASTQLANPTLKDPVDIWPPPEGCDAIYKILAHGETADSPMLVQPGQEFHPQVSVDAPWGDEAVQAIAFHPLTDNKKVLHHWILYAGQGAFLNGWAPGDDARSPLPADVGMDMPTGRAAMRLDLHYNSLSATGPEEDRSGVEVCIVKGANLRKVSAAVTMSLNAIGFPLAPANTVNHAATGVCDVVGSTPVHLLSASPHSHTLAIGHKFTVKKKDGREIVMLDRPFQFGEQKSYNLEPELVLEAGDSVTTTCFYTNPTNQNVSFGENTGNEMCFNFATYYPKGSLVCGGLSGLLGGVLGGR